MLLVTIATAWWSESSNGQISSSDNPAPIDGKLLTYPIARALVGTHDTIAGLRVTSRFIAGSSGQAIYLSTDAGKTWTPKSIDPSSFLVANGWLFASAGAQIFRSKDQGSSWVEASIPGSKDTNLVAAGQSLFGLADDKIYKSDDNGDHWSEIHVPDCDSISVLSASGSRVAYSCDGDQPAADSTDDKVAGAKILDSTDAGHTWTSLGSVVGDVHSLIVTPSSVFVSAFAKGHGTRLLHKSKIDPWVDLTPGGGFTGEFAVSETGICAAQKANITCSSDLGKSWRQAQAFAGTLQALLASGTTIVAIQETDDHIVTCYASRNGGASWSTVAPIPHSEFRGATMQQGLVYLRSSEKALLISLDRPDVWHEIPHVLPRGGAKAIANLHDDLFLLSASDRVSGESPFPGLFRRNDRKIVYRSTNGGQTWIPLELPNSLLGYRWLDSSDGTAFLIGSAGTFWTKDGSHWNELTVEGKRKVVLANSRNKKMYVLTAELRDPMEVLGDPSLSEAEKRKQIDDAFNNGTKRRLSVSGDDGKSWMPISRQADGFDQAKLLQLDIDSQDNVFLSTQYSIERRMSSGQWENMVRGAIGGLKILSFYAAPDDVLYVGTSHGLFWSNDRGENWHGAEGALGSLLVLSGSVSHLTRYKDQEFLAVNETNLFLCVSGLAGPPPDTFALALDIAPQRDAVVLIDGHKQTDITLAEDKGVVELRGPKSALDRLRDGAHQVTISARAAGQSMAQNAYIYKELLMAKAFKPYGRSYALVVAASGSWDKQEFADLSAWAAPQAREVSQALRLQGFEVTELFEEKASRDNVEAYLQDLQRKLQRDDRVLFYFSGHGYTVPSATGDVGYLLTYPATEATVLTRGIPMARIESEYSNILRAKHVLFVLDACFSGLATRDQTTPNPDRLKEFLKYEELVDYTGRPSRVVLAAGDKNQAALDINGGIFTKAFLEGIKGAADGNNNGVITIDHLYAYILTRVQSEARIHGHPQVPQLDRLPYYGSGKFVFITK